MSEGQGDSPADVRSFLPRSGEPVDEYAARLRVLHRDLTLVLEAVERGLDPAEPVREREPVPVGARERVAMPARVVAPAPASLAPPVPAAAPAPIHAPLSPGAARVEVMPAPSGERRREEDEADRRDPLPEPPPARTRRFPPRPSAVEAGTTAGPGPVAVREPEWVEREGPEPEVFTAPLFPPHGPAPLEPPRVSVPPALVAGLVAGWLTVVGLLVALLVG